MAMMTKGRPSGRLVFASAMQATVVLPAVAANLSLPSVTVPSDFLPPGAQIARVTAGVGWRKQVDSSGLANAIDGDQEIQVRSDAPGSFIDAVSIVDNALATLASVTDVGGLQLGDTDVVGEVDEADTYEFQWTLALVDGASLTLHDLQTFILFDYA